MDSLDSQATCHVCHVWSPRRLHVALRTLSREDTSGTSGRTVVFRRQTFPKHLRPPRNNSFAEAQARNNMNQLHISSHKFGQSNIKHAPALKMRFAATARMLNSCRSRNQSLNQSINLGLTGGRPWSSQPCWAILFGAVQRGSARHLVWAVR